jgi:hypothetical protein
MLKSQFCPRAAVYGTVILPEQGSQSAWESHISHAIALHKLLFPPLCVVLFRSSASLFLPTLRNTLPLVSRAGFLCFFPVRKLHPEVGNGNWRKRSRCASFPFSCLVRQRKQKEAAVRSLYCNRLRAVPSLSRSISYPFLTQAIQSRKIHAANPTARTH